MTQATSIFEQASRKKIRFESVRGQLHVEDLWDLPLTSKDDRPNLDAIAIELHRKIEAQGTTSFVKTAKKDEILQLKFDIVKHVIEVRQAENEEKTAEAGKRVQREKLDRLIQDAEDKELANLPVDELKKMRDALL
jgi:hypothetical protein